MHVLGHAIHKAHWRKFDMASAGASTSWETIMSGERKKVASLEKELISDQVEMDRLKHIVKG
jgi:hypothetical protein